MMRAGVVGIVVAVCVAAWAQAPAPTGAPAPSLASAPAAAPAVNPTAAGGKLHGTVKSGSIPLPGVTVTAQNTLTGKRYSTTTDVTGAWQMNIPQNGRYVIRTQFAAFAQGSQEAVLNATSRDQLVNFELILASRQAEADQQQAREVARSGASGQGVRQMAGNAPQNVSLESALSADTDTGAGTEGQSGAALPSIAANSDFSDQSVAISGQAGQVSAYVGMNPDDRLNAGGGPQGGPGEQNGQGSPGLWRRWFWRRRRVWRPWRRWLRRTRRRGWRRHARQLPRIQSCPTTRIPRLVWQYFLLQCAAVRLARPAAVTAA
jgi:hypothetical protein